MQIFPQGKVSLIYSDLKKSSLSYNLPERFLITLFSFSFFNFFYAYYLNKFISGSLLICRIGKYTTTQKSVRHTSMISESHMQFSYVFVLPIMTPLSKISSTCSLYKINSQRASISSLLITLYMPNRYPEWN